MNYARYLQNLMEKGVISNWAYQAFTFWFDAIERGVRSYTPDFEVKNIDDSIEYHEVKGYIDARSKTIFNRMRIYYPKIKLCVIDKKWFVDNEKKLEKIIPEWES